MDDSMIIVSLDIGTTAMKVVVASVSKGQISVIGIGSSHAQGMNRGVIVDIDKASEAIREAVKKAASQSNTEVHDVVVSLPANGVQIFPCQGAIAINDQTKEIDNDDVQQVMSAALVQTLPAEQEYVALIPNDFSVDGFKNIKDPRGMIGSRLEFNGILYSLPKSIVHNVFKAVERAGLHVVHEVLAPAALSQVALNDGEKNFGAIIIDLGGGQSTASVIHDRKLKFSTVDTEGGNLVVHDISVVLNTTLNNAAKLQRYYGTVDTKSASNVEEFPVEVVGQDEPQAVTSEYLSEIIAARMQQIFIRLQKKLDSVKAFELPGGVIITGGLAEMDGVDRLAQKIFGVKVKVFVPKQMGLRHPAFTESLGLVSYAQSLNELDILAHEVIRQRKSTNYSDDTHFISQNENQTSKSYDSSSKTTSTPMGEKFKNFWKKFFD
ncbi:cell division protein FtsA [Bombilactobacillus bombi]|uniref:Cell division protein FtsA n=1 Tax=Bombilactobacillus bombi TaxID=1303590 RepID=A0A3R6XS34_9LACO|nr:cell division protein FtsA [Bombilactobacillus bombi]RHW46881.1 cell division protein FtsA [Bombilactobacillus bombi]